MDKLKIKVISEKSAAINKGGCGRNYYDFCGARTCVGGKRAD